MLGRRRVIRLIRRGWCRGLRSGSRRNCRSTCLRCRCRRIRIRGRSRCLWLRLVCVRRRGRRNRARYILRWRSLEGRNHRPNIVPPMPTGPRQPGKNQNWNDDSQRRFRRRLVILQQIRDAILRRRLMRQAQHRSAVYFLWRRWNLRSSGSRAGRQLGPAHAAESMLQIVHVPAFFAPYRHRIKAITKAADASEPGDEPV